MGYVFRKPVLIMIRLISTVSTARIRLLIMSYATPGKTIMISFLDSQCTAHIIMSESWDPLVSSQLKNYEMKLKVVLKLAGVDFWKNSVLLEHRHLSQACASWNSGHQL